MISVIIPSYNSETTIGKCLDALLSQSYDGNYEIILVDSSTDRTPQIVSSEYPNVQFIHFGQKTDPGTARNAGIRKARGDLIAFIDSDCVAAHDWLENIEAAHRSLYNVVGGSVNNGNDKEDLVAWAGYVSEFREFLPEQPKQDVMHIPTCNISYKKNIFAKFGSFKGEYYPQEDLVYNYNLQKNGEKILFDPTIQVYHHHRSELGSFLSHQKRIGAITSKVLKVVDLEGASIVRHPYLALLLLPFLPIVKFLRTVFVFLRHQPGAILKRPLVLPIFGLGLIFWLTGFASGIYRKDFAD